MQCESCGGTGQYNDDGEMITCLECNGDGERCCTRCTAGVGDIDDDDEY